MTSVPPRFGLTGTGYRARVTAEAAAGFEAYLWGDSGRPAAPTEITDRVAALRTALTELAENTRSGRTGHPCDVRFGRDVDASLAEAQRQIDERAAR